ncbi:site-specific DNA-methyltransferase [Tianweitania sediminis]|uniref:site-specific DNA-methyltransferase (adenine-specific) n=1 Tax=Tianweitania sediminis TaxID=1502156 RepID=A0A8J7RMC4_9HYPH|nr:DNA methyltransferase [Tianweitania sediminis]MBP0438384.1 ParB N-terminal domain-containing protein [Tianweitania sediminis]
MTPPRGPTKASAKIAAALRTDFELVIELIPVTSLKPYERNARTHSKAQVKQITASIRSAGFVNPILIDENDEIIAGHGRLEAAVSLGMETVPVVRLVHLTSAQKRTLRLADNKIADNAGYNLELLAMELKELVIEESFEIEASGFSITEVDRLIFEQENAAADPADSFAEPEPVAVSRPGDLFRLGVHRLLCGDARKQQDLERVCGPDLIDMAFLDPPYNVRVAEIVGRGSIKHDEFAMASGEMSTPEFRFFLKEALTAATASSRNGALHYICMDWRHVEDVLAVGGEVYGCLINIVVWQKSNGGQGSFYRSAHEMIPVFRVGGEQHLNTIELGRHGRNRSNVWQYAGVNTFGKERMAELASHPTVKPVAMVVDAIRDCTKRGDLVLDTFAGSGTTIVACERSGRVCRAVEYSPGYVDVAIRRWQTFTGKDAVHVETGLTFDELAAERGEAA